VVRLEHGLGPGQECLRPVLRKNIIRHYATLCVLNLLAGSGAGF
jgi:hypothetical protein